MEETIIFDNENELIKWIVYDLNNQRLEISFSKYFAYYLVPAHEVTIRIIPPNSEISQVEINFDFSMKNIIKRLSNNADLVYFNALYSNINIRNVKFNKSVNFNDFEFKTNILFTNVHFCSYVDFSNSIFEKSVSFEYSQIDTLTNFSQSYFKDDVNFTNNKIKETIISNIRFYKSCNFRNNTIVSDITIYKLIDNVNASLTFNNMIFDNENSLLSIINSNFEYIILLDTRIKGIINIEHSSVNIVNLKYSCLNGGVINITNLIIKNFANRESALFFKNQAYARNNIIDALEYKAKEIEMHKKELLNKPNKTFKDSFDIISIFFMHFNYTFHIFCNIIYSFKCFVFFIYFIFIIFIH